MPRDANLVKRNLLAIPGALLAFYATLGLVYVLAYRGSGTVCQNPQRFLVAGACYGALPFLIAFLLLGLVLLILGLTLMQGKVTRLDGHLRAGTPTHVFLALLTSCAVVPILTAAILSYIQGTEGITFATEVGTLLVKTTFLLWLAAAIALVALIPVLILAASHRTRRRRFLHQALIVSREPAPEPGPAGSEVPAATLSTPAEPDGRAASPPEEFVDESLWPKARQ